MTLTPRRSLRAAFLALLLLFAGTPALAQQALTTEQALARIDSLFAAHNGPGTPGGMSVAIVRDGKIIWEKGYGFADREKNIPATPQTIYRVMSVSKLFTATALMKLRDEGKVRLDDPITRFLPGYKVKSSFPDTRVPTLRQLVSHTSGLPKEMPPEGPAGPTNTIDDLVANLAVQELTIPPYTEFKYSNLGVAVLAGGLEKACGHSLPEYVEAEILRPLGMTHSGFTTTPALKPLLAVPYGSEGTAAPSGDFNAAMAPVGGLLSSVEDMSRFLAMHMNEGPAGGMNLLGVSTLREMRAPIFLAPDWQSAIATGWWLQRVGDEAVAWHGGSGIGFMTAVMIVPELNLGISVFANSLADAPALATDALRILTPAVRAARGEVEVEPLAEITPDQFDRYIGIYTLQDLAELEVLVQNGHLTSRLTKGPTLPPIKYVRAGPDRYLMKGGPFSGEYLTFEKDDGGKVVRIHNGPYVFVRK